MCKLRSLALTFALTAPALTAPRLNSIPLPLAQARHITADIASITVAPPPGQDDQHFFRREIPAASGKPVALTLTHLPDGWYNLAVYRAGYERNDAYTAYLRVGAPSQITRPQVIELQPRHPEHPQKPHGARGQGHPRTEVPCAPKRSLLCDPHAGVGRTVIYFRSGLLCG
jgi:hypothetical protein